jgi:tetratricopeptide (TPR) repeat protein
VISLHRLRPAASAAVAALALTWSATSFAQNQGAVTYSRTSVSGNFLAARHAGSERDAAAAAAYYRAALRGDPRNSEILSRAFLAVLANGEIDEAMRLAERVAQADKNDRIAHLALGVRAIKQKQYPAARREIAQSVRGPITDLTAALLTGWTQATPGESKAAVEAVDKLGGPEWYNLFKSLHTGLILDQTGQKKDAAKRYERAFQLDPTMLRVVQAYGSYLSRQGSKDDALKVFKSFDEAIPRHPLALEAINDINAGRRLAPLVDSPQAGAAEVLYGIGAALGRRGGEDLSLIYLQLSLYLAPGHQTALVSLADLYESLKKPELAIKVYDRISPNSPMRRNAQIQRALDLDSLERTEEAKTILAKLVTDDPSDLEAVLALGNVLRGRKLFAECADTYAKGIATISKPERPNWVLYYFSGICNERSKRWPKAEADFKTALALFPDQPLVLNYLGYSWVDQGVNIEEGTRMIRRAVEQRADDGYIVDSLGWAYFRVGNFDEAVKHLEQAVELKPEDPTINDHLGDAYWKIGRLLEARFQWAHARDLNPEDPQDLVKIEEKLKEGLTDTPASAQVDRPKKPDGKPDGG